MSVADDAIRFKCPACNKRLKAPPSLAGKPVGCSFCAAKVPVPLLESTSVEPPSNVTLLPLAEPDEMPVLLPAPAPFADLTDRLPARRTRREVTRYDDEDDVPIRTRGRGTREAGPAAVSGAFIGSLLGVVLSVPAALFFSQYAPIFGGFIQSIARPFSPARLESIPVHLLGCGLVAMAMGAAAGAGSGYLGAKKGPGAGWAGCVLAVLVVAVLAAAVFVVLYFRQDYPERLK